MKKEKTVIFGICDFCNHEAHLSHFNECKICKKDLCYDCSHRFTFGKKEFNLCKDHFEIFMTIVDTFLESDSLSQFIFVLKNKLDF